MTEQRNRMLPLTETQREAALNAARLKVAGALVLPDEPRPDAYSAQTHALYPPAVSNAITGLSVLMLVAAFVPSAMRLHKVGFDAFSAIFAGQTASIYWAALCVVLMAEIGETIFILGATTAKRWNRAGMIFGALVCAVIALSGNALAVGEHAFDNVFAFLETFAPPVIVLLVSNILKTQILDAIKARHNARMKYESDLAEWKSQTANAKAAHVAALANAEQHFSFERLRSFALRAALERANARMTTVLSALDDDDWRALVARELRSDQWYNSASSSATQITVEAVRPQAVEAPALRLRLPMPSGGRAGRYTGELDNAIVPNADGTFTSKCPKCDASYTRDTEKSAKNALVAHTKVHRASVAKTGSVNDAAE